MKQVKEYIVSNKNNIIVLILSAFLVFAMNISLNPELWLVNSFKGNDVFWIIQFVLYIVFLNSVMKITDNRLRVISLIISLIFSLCAVIGYTVNNYEFFFQTLFTNHYLIKAIIKFIGYLIIFYSVIAVSYNWLNNYLKKDEKNEANIKKVETGKIGFNKKIFLIFWGVIFVLYVPYFLQYYPGILSFDSASEIGEATGVQQLTNQHPLLHIFMVFIPMTLGKLVGDYNIGVAIYSIMQMLIMSGIFAFVLAYMKSKKVPNIFVGISFIFFAFYPVNGLFSITMWKDVIFGLAVLLMTCCVIELITNTDKFMNSKKMMILLILSILGVMLLRHNGFYAGLIFLPFLFVLDKKYYKKVLCIIGIVLVSIFTYRFVVANMDSIEKGNPVESISVCVQQIARSVKYNEDKFTNEEIEQINKFFEFDKLGELYQSYISDPVKGNFNSAYYEDNKGEFIKLWLSLLLKYPQEYIEAFIYNNYGYWYPETWNFIVIKGFSSPEHSTLVNLDIKSTPLIDNPIVSNVADIVEKRNIPLVSFFFSVGFSFWLVVLCLGYVIYQRKYRSILVFLPVILVWCTILASPVFCEYRYVYSIFVTLPALMSMIYLKEENTIRQLSGDSERK